MSEKIDVLVIGAGPAGSVSASMLHQAGYSVRVVEREKFPRFVIANSWMPSKQKSFRRNLVQNL